MNFEQIQQKGEALISSITETFFQPQFTKFSLIHQEQIIDEIQSFLQNYETIPTTDQFKYVVNFSNKFNEIRINIIDNLFTPIQKNLTEQIKLLIDLTRIIKNSSFIDSVSKLIKHSPIIANFENPSQFIKNELGRITRISARLFKMPYSKLKRSISTIVSEIEKQNQLYFDYIYNLHIAISQFDEAIFLYIHGL